MGVGFGGTLDSQRGSCKFIFKKVLVQQVEQLIEIASNTVIRSQLFRSKSSLKKGSGYSILRLYPLRCDVGYGSLSGAWSAVRQGAFLMH